MTKEEIIDKAVWVQYPNNGIYKEYNINKEIHKLPILDNSFLYRDWTFNTHHFTTKYHRLYSLPLFAKLLNFNYNENDFILKERIGDGKFDISMLYPKTEFKYEIYGFNHNEHFDNISYDDIVHSNVSFSMMTDYHRLYKYPHENSRLINKTLNNERKLFISGDSHMIPNISVLSCYFNEIWYFDNRNGLSLYDKWKDIYFTDILIEIGCTGQDDYIVKNLR